MKYDPLIDYGKKDLSIEENLIFCKFSELIKNLIIISSDSNKQNEYISFGAISDEIAIDFETYYTLSYQSFLDFRLINIAQKQKLDELDDYFNSKSGDKNPDFWDDVKLGTNPEWEVARNKAREILKLLNKDNLTIEYYREEKYDDFGKLIMQTTYTRLTKKNLSKKNNKVKY